LAKTLAAAFHSSKPQRIKLPRFAGGNAFDLSDHGIRLRSDASIRDDAFVADLPRRAVCDERRKAFFDRLLHGRKFCFQVPL